MSKPKKRLATGVKTWCFLFDLAVGKQLQYNIKGAAIRSMQASRKRKPQDGMDQLCGEEPQSKRICELEAQLKERDEIIARLQKRINELENGTGPNRDPLQQVFYFYCGRMKTESTNTCFSCRGML